MIFGRQLATALRLIGGIIAGQILIYMFQNLLWSRFLAALQVTEDTRRLAAALIEDGSLPVKAEVDAFHVAVAAVHGINYLLTWNCVHIANAVMRPKIEAVCRSHGFEPPIICIPSELFEG